MAILEGEANSHPEDEMPPRKSETTVSRRGYHPAGKRGRPEKGDGHAPEKRL